VFLQIKKRIARPLSGGQLSFLLLRIRYYLI